uniref:C2 domain-containing protein n=1 Tax=Macrostomum lignano TaxID=282301 RepID=A0A1I8FIM7_9PLAT
APQAFQQQPQAMMQQFQPQQSISLQSQASIGAADGAVAAAEQFQYDTAGEISVQLHFDDYDSSLTVHIARARGLPPMDLNGLADPFVKVRLMPDPTDSTIILLFQCGPAARQIKYLPNTLEPDWQQTVVFMDVPKRELKKHWLDISVWDYDRLKTNDFMGAASFGWVRLVWDRKLMDNQPRWYTLYAHEKEMPQPPMPRRPVRRRSLAAAHRVGGNDSQKSHRHSDTPTPANGGAAGKEQQQWSLGGCGTAASQSDSSCSTVNTDFLSEEQRESVRRWLGPGQLLLIGEATRTERGGDLPDDQLVSGELFLDLRLSAESNDGGRLRVTPRQCRNLVAAAAGLHCCCELSLLGTARARRRTRAQRLGLSGTMEFDSQQLAAARSATSGLLLLQATLLSGKVSASSELGGGEIKGPGRRRLGEAVICVDDDCAVRDAGGGPLGRKPHGRLDCDYAISGLLKAQPMFDFGQLDRMKPQAPLPPWKVGGPGARWPGADSERQRIEQRLRQLYGDQLFRPGKYVAPDQLGPALEPRKLGASSVQVS